MKLLSEKVQEIVDLKNDNSLGEKLHKVEQLIAEIKKTGLIKKTTYELPLVDTIGKTYYSTLNKH